MASPGLLDYFFFNSALLRSEPLTWPWWLGWLSMLATMLPLLQLSYALSSSWHEIGMYLSPAAFCVSFLAKGTDISIIMSVLLCNLHWFLRRDISRKRERGRNHTVGFKWICNGMLSQISGAESSHNDSVIDFVLYGIPLPPLLRMFGVYIYHWSLGSPDVAKWNIGNICRKEKKTPYIDCTHTGSFVYWFCFPIWVSQHSVLT